MSSVDEGIFCRHTNRVVPVIPQESRLDQLREVERPPVKAENDDIV